MDNKSLLQDSKNNLEWPYKGIRKLFLELTRNCERKCIHCYNNSSPSGMKELSKSFDGNINFMTQELWEEVLNQASDLKADHIQFTGGEPTRVPYLKKLLEKAVKLNFSRIELYTNCATLPSDDFVSFIQANNIGIGTSFYSLNPKEHEKIVGRDDWETTVGSIKKYLSKKINLRVGLILMGINESNCDATTEFLIELGVKKENINYDNVRPFGRALEEVNSHKEFCDPHDPDLMTHLCGKCYKNIAIQPSGHISPCVFWQKPLGIFPINSLAEVLKSQDLWKVRSDIVASNQRHLDSRGTSNTDCSPACSPDYECSPDDSCSPDDKSTCSYERCIIEGLGKTNEAKELELLRRFRDETLLNDEVGRVLVHLYYRISPRIASKLNTNRNLGYELVYQNVIQPLCNSIKSSDYYGSINQYAKGITYLASNLDDANKEFIINELIELEHSNSVPKKLFSKYLNQKVSNEIVDNEFEY